MALRMANNSFVSQCLPLLGQDCSNASIKGVHFDHKGYLKIWRRHYKGGCHRLLGKLAPPESSMQNCLSCKVVRGAAMVL